MAPRYYLFHTKSDEFLNIQSGYDLPYSDNSQYISGFLVDKNISDEALKRVAEHNFRNKSQYYLGQTVFEDHEPKLNEAFTLLEKGNYIVTLSGPGYNNTDNHSKFEGTWEKVAIKDTLKINSDFTWERKKEIDFGFFLTWNGAYSYSGDLLVFSLSKQGYSGEVFSGISDNYIPHYGLMYGPIDNTRVINEPVEGRISGFISDNVSGIINDIGKGTGSCIAYSNSTATVEGIISGTFTNIPVEHFATGTGYGTDSKVYYGYTTNILSEMGYARVDADISGKITGNAHYLLSRVSDTINGAGFVENAMAKINPTTFNINGSIEDKARDVPISNILTETVNNILISGNANGTASTTILCEVSGTATNVPVSNNLARGTANGILISGVIRDTVNNVLISGETSGYANNVPISGSIQGIVDSAVISDVITTTQIATISGIIRNTVNNVNFAGTVNGVCPEFPVNGTGYGEVSGCTFEDYISGNVYGTISVKYDDYIDMESYFDISVTFLGYTLSAINQCKRQIYNSISGSIGTNEENYFGSTSGQIRTMLSGAIERTVDKTSLIKIISPVYLSNSVIYELTDKILFDVIMANGAYISGNAFISGYEELSDISGSISGIIYDGKVIIDQGSAKVNDKTVDVSAHSLSTNVGVSAHSLSGNVGVSAHSLSGNVEVSAHSRSTDVALTNNHSRSADVVVNASGIVTQQPAFSAHGITQPVINDHTITQPVINDHTITQPVINDHTITQPVINDHTANLEDDTVILSGLSGVITNDPVGMDIISGYISGQSFISGYGHIKGTNINSFRNLIATKIRDTIISILSNIPIDETVFGSVSNYTISDIISGEVFGPISGTITTAVSGNIGGTITGYAGGTISGTVKNTISFENISGNISKEVQGLISGIGYGTANALVYVVGIGDVDVEVDKIILSTFLDDSFSDLTNFYTISGIANYEESSHNPGGRGQLLKYMIINPDYDSDIHYDVGSFDNNTNTKIQNVSPPLEEAVSGNIREPPYNNYFGGIGGNVILNSLDFLIKNKPENGYVKFVYGGPYSELCLKKLEITISGEIEVLPDETAQIISGAIINTMINGIETDVYYRITDRTKELDLEESTLNGTRLSEYNIKYEEPKLIYDEDSNYLENEQLLRTVYQNNELYIVELDNHRRKLFFKTPSKSNFNEEEINSQREQEKINLKMTGDFIAASDEVKQTMLSDFDKTTKQIINDERLKIKLDLKTTGRKFYFAIARDNQIDTVKINNILFHPDDQDKDGIYRKRKKRINDIVQLDKYGEPIYEEYDYGFNAGDTPEIEIKFKDETVSLMKELICNYLSDCLESDSISKSNNYTQTISPFNMPARDVLLFLKTESAYILNIFISESSSGRIDRVVHESVMISNKNTPIVMRYFRDDEIIIEVYFNDPFSEIDREDLKNQLPDVDDIRYNDGERPYEPLKGYDTEIPQVIKFLMPARNLTLYLKEKDYRNKLKLLRKKDTMGFTEVSICEEHLNAPLEMEADDPLNNRWETVYYRDGDPITITVHFIEENNKCLYEVDKVFMQAQYASISFNDGRISLIPYGFSPTDQIFTFQMPNNDLELIIKENTLHTNLIIKPEPYQYKNGALIEGIIYNSEFKTFDEVESEINFTRISVIKGDPKVDIYVKFKRIEVHLDKDYLTSQEPLMNIEEAGDYNLNQNPFLPSEITSENYKNGEYYQHIYFPIREDNQTLILKLVERKFRIYMDCQISYTTAVSIKENDDLLNVSTFPYETYPKIAKQDGTVIDNRIVISQELLPNMDISTSKSSYSLDKVETGGEPFDNIVTLTRNKPMFNISFNMPKDNIRLFLDIHYTEVVILSKWNFCVDSTIRLARGNYTIWVGGAKGGYGGEASYIGAPLGAGENDFKEGSHGANIMFKFDVERPTTLRYSLGQIGGNGIKGTLNYSGPGGGGGGNSCLEFSSEVTRTDSPGGTLRRININGGKGGDGARYRWMRQEYYLEGTTRWVHLFRIGRTDYGFNMPWIELKSRWVTVGEITNGGPGGPGGGVGRTPNLNQSGNGIKGSIGGPARGIAGLANFNGGSSGRGGEGGTGFILQGTQFLSQLFTTNPESITDFPEGAGINYVGDGFLIVRFNNRLSDDL